MIIPIRHSDLIVSSRGRISESPNGDTHLHILVAITSPFYLVLNNIYS